MAHGHACQRRFREHPLHPGSETRGRTPDPAKDEASGDVCKAYGAAAIMRLPGRGHITWQDDSTLKIETDTGLQTRLLIFNGKPAADLKPSRQGFSSAQWEQPERGIAFRGKDPPRRRSRQGRPGARSRHHHLLPGDQRKNGFPVSGDAVVKEDFDHFTQRSGRALVRRDHDRGLPRSILQEPFVTSSNFKKEPDGSKWRPRPCVAR